LGAFESGLQKFGGGGLGETDPLAGAVATPAERVLDWLIH